MDTIHMVRTRKRTGVPVRAIGPGTISEGAAVDFIMEPQLGINISLNAEQGRFGQLHGRRPEP